MNELIEIIQSTGFANHEIVKAVTRIPHRPELFVVVTSKDQPEAYVVTVYNVCMEDNKVKHVDAIGASCKYLKGK